MIKNKNVSTTVEGTWDNTERNCSSRIPTIYINFLGKRKTAAWKQCSVCHLKKNKNKITLRVVVDKNFLYN